MSVYPWRRPALVITVRRSSRRARLSYARVLEALGPAPRLFGEFLDWENFDRIYQIARREFFELRSLHHL